DRQKIIQEPLFAGYLFVRIHWTPENRNAVLRKPGAVTLVGSKGLGTPIPDKQIDDIKTLLARNVEWKHSPFLQAGDKVRVRGGALEIPDKTTGSRPGNSAT